MQSKQALNCIFESSLRAGADVGGGRFVAAFSDGLIGADIGGAGVAVTGDSHKGAGFGLLSVELEIQHGLAG